MIGQDVGLAVVPDLRLHPRDVAIRVGQGEGIAGVATDRAATLVEIVAERRGGRKTVVLCERDA